MTSKTQVVFESTEGMSDACRSGLHHLLVACADTKLLLGYHYGEWTFGAPALEAAVAECSLAQSELGHVRLLHGVLKNHFGDDPDGLVERRSPAEFAAVGYLNRPISDWAGLVAANYVVDLAVTRMLHSLRDSSFKPLAMSVAKMLEEERYHIHHGTGWFRTLANDRGESHGAVRQAVDAALASVNEWFGPADRDTDLALVEAGVKDRGDRAICRDLFDDMSRTAAELEVTLQFPDAFESDGWTSAIRRAVPDGPDEDILYHLRGGQNQIFKLA